MKICSLMSLYCFAMSLRETPLLPNSVVKTAIQFEKFVVITKNHVCSGSANTVRHRGMETELMETILRFASVSPRKMETLLLGSWWP